MMFQSMLIAMDVILEVFRNAPNLGAVVKLGANQCPKNRRIFLSRLVYMYLGCSLEYVVMRSITQKA